MLLCTTTTLWLTTGVVSRIQAGQRVSRWVYLGMGIIAGLGWWTTPLVMGCYAAAVLVWVLALGRRCCSCRLIYLFLGFAAASLPRWGPHLREGWSALHSLLAMGRLPTVAILRGILVERMPDLIGLWHERPVRLAGWITMVVLLILSLCILVRRWRCAGLRGNALSIFAALLGILLHLATVSLGPYAASPMTCTLLPLVPLLALLLGVATESMGRHLAWGMGWLPLLFLISPHLAQLSVYRQWRAVDEAFRGRVQALQSELVAEGIEGVYSDYGDARGGYGLNVMTGEAICFSDPQREHQGAYHERMEQSSRIAVLNNYGGIRDLLRGTRGRGRCRDIAGFTLHDRFEPPPRQAEIAPSHWLRATSTGGAECATALADGSLATRWQVQGASADGPWSDLAPQQRVTSYFWSGTRPYYGGGGYRVEGQFNLSTTERIRLRLTPPAGAEVGAVAEVQWMGPSQREATAPSDVTALLEVLQQRQVRHLYADRWLAGQVGARSQGRVVATMESAKMELQAWSAMVVGPASARLCRDVLLRAGIPVREMRVGPWVLFDVAPGAWQQSYAGRNGLVWAGYSCLAE